MSVRPGPTRSGDRRTFAQFGAPLVRLARTSATLRRRSGARAYRDPQLDTATPDRTANPSAPLPRETVRSPGDRIAERDGPAPATPCGDAA